MNDVIDQVKGISPTRARNFYTGVKLTETKAPYHQHTRGGNAPPAVGLSPQSHSQQGHRQNNPAYGLPRANPRTPLPTLAQYLQPAPQQAEQPKTPET